MNKQEVFTKVKNHLLSQNSKSMINPLSGTCAYRGYNDKQCAVGCLIPDEAYSVMMEYKTVWTLTNDFPQLLTYGISKENSSLLMDLQLIHDSGEPADWESHLKRVAKDYNLEY